MFQFLDFLLDESGFELKRGETAIRVERRVFDLIVYLIKNRERAVTKEELVEQVWKQRCVGESVIARCVSSARKVVSDPEAIRTIYGRGYRWVAHVDETRAANEVRTVSGPALKAVEEPRPEPFFGREHELALASTAIDDCRTGAGRVVLLSGEAGIGKSRLALEITSMARDRGVVVGWGHAFDDGNTAYLPWWQAFRDLRESRRVPPSADALLKFLEPGALEVPGTPNGINRLRFFDGLRTLLRDAATLAPLAVVIDDLHHTDMPSLRLFEWLSEHVRESPILLIGTYRDAELANDPARSACIVKTIRSVVPLTIELRGLGRDEAARLLSQRMERPCEAAIAETARGMTGGNPFFLMQIAPFLPTEVGDTADLAQRLPPRVRDAIIRQLDAVPAPCRALLEAAAVVGFRFELRLLTEAADLPLPTVSALLETAVHAGLLQKLTLDPNRFAFKHELVRQVLYEDLAVSERRQLHLKVGRALERGPSIDRDARASELARHFCQASTDGDANQALHYASEAAAVALRHFAWESAVEFLEMALLALERSSAAREDTFCSLLIDLATAQFRAGSRSLASETFARAGELAKKLGDDDALVRIAVAFSAGIHGIELSFDTALVPLLEAALRIEGADIRSQALLHARLALALFWTDDHERRLGHARSARALFEPLEGDDEVLAYVKAAELSCLERPGSLEERLRSSAETIELTRRAGAYELCSLAHIMRLIACGEAGDFESARRHALELEDLARRTREPFLSYVASKYKVVLTQIGGDLAALERLVEETLRAADAMGRASSRISGMNTLVWIRIQQGRAAEVIDVARECAAVAERAMPATKLLHALALAKASDRAEAQRVLGDMSALHSALRRDPTWLAAVALLAELSFCLPEATPPPALYDHLLPFRERFVPWGGTSAFFLGSVERYLGLLAAASGSFDVALDHFEIAIRENTRIGAELAATHSRVECATVLHRLGGTKRSAEAAKLRVAALSTANARGFGLLVRELS